MVRLNFRVIERDQHGVKTNEWMWPRLLSVKVRARDTNQVFKVMRAEFVSTIGSVGVLPLGTRELHPEVTAI